MSGTQDSAGPSIETLDAALEINYSWGYEQSRANLRDLYQKATRSQWLPDDVLNFSTDVDLEKPMSPEMMHPLYGSHVYDKLTERERTDLSVELTSWMVSQFLHGEQGALLATSQLVCAVPEFDAKLYASTQVVDEGRHVAVYHKYLEEKIGFSYPVSPYLKTLLDLILKDSRWDMKLIGMQIMVEGLALAAFGMVRTQTYEPLLKEITRYIMLDEARHVAFGVLALRDYYQGLSQAEVREREDFVYEAAVLMRDRFLFQEVWEKAGMPVKECTEIALHNRAQVLFRQMLFAKIVPAIKKIGLLSDRLRERFEGLGILQYENAADPFAELEAAERAVPIAP